VHGAAGKTCQAVRFRAAPPCEPSRLHHSLTSLPIAHFQLLTDFSNDYYYRAFTTLLPSRVDSLIVRCITQASWRFLFFVPHHGAPSSKAYNRNTSPSHRNRMPQYIVQENAEEVVKDLGPSFLASFCRSRHRSLKWKPLYEALRFLD
jgi:hypothetical protein